MALERGAFPWRIEELDQRFFAHGGFGSKTAAQTVAVLCRRESICSGRLS